LFIGLYYIVVCGIKLKKYLNALIKIKIYYYDRFIKFIL